MAKHETIGGITAASILEDIGMLVLTSLPSLFASGMSGVKSESAAVQVEVERDESNETKESKVGQSVTKGTPEGLPRVVSSPEARAVESSGGGVTE